MGWIEFNLGLAAIAAIAISMISCFAWGFHEGQNETENRWRDAINNKAWSDRAAKEKLP